MRNSNSYICMCFFFTDWAEKNKNKCDFRLSKVPTTELGKGMCRVRRWYRTCISKCFADCILVTSYWESDHQRDVHLSFVLSHDPFMLSVHDLCLDYCVWPRLFLDHVCTVFTLWICLLFVFDFMLCFWICALFCWPCFCLSILLLKNFADGFRKQRLWCCITIMMLL